MAKLKTAAALAAQREKSEKKRKPRAILSSTEKVTRAENRITLSLKSLLENRRECIPMRRAHQTLVIGG